MKNNEFYSIENYKEAFSFALQAHGKQETPNGLPYSFHIVSVTNEIINSLFFQKFSFDEANIAIACALLHDINEDTPYKVSNCLLNLENIKIIEKGVEALTKNSSLPKQEQMQDSLNRLKKQPVYVQMVKLADRITNLDPAPLFWNKEKRKKYVDEAKLILDTLGDSNLYLADKLQQKIQNYKIDTVMDKFDNDISDDYLVFYAEDSYLLLDKNHSNYLTTFKALNRLNSYLKKEYNIELFRVNLTNDYFKNIESKDLNKYEKRVSMGYIVQKLNEKDLLNLNKQIDNIVEKYITTVFEGEKCFFI